MSRVCSISVFLPNINEVMHLALTSRAQCPQKWNILTCIYSLSRLALAWVLHCDKAVDFQSSVPTDIPTRAASFVVHLRTMQIELCIYCNSNQMTLKLEETSGILSLESSPLSNWIRARDFCLSQLQVLIETWGSGFYVPFRKKVKFFLLCKILN